MKSIEGSAWTDFDFLKFYQFNDNDVIFSESKGPGMRFFDTKFHTSLTYDTPKWVKELLDDFTLSIAQESDDYTGGNYMLYYRFDSNKPSAVVHSGDYLLKDDSLGSDNKVYVVPERTFEGLFFPRPN